MIPDAIVRRRLWIMLCIYEALIISIVAAAGLNIALMGGGSIFMAAPLLLISCAEGAEDSVVGDGDALALAEPIARGDSSSGDCGRLGGGARSRFRILPAKSRRRHHARERRVDRAQRTVDREAATNTNLAGEVTALDAQIAALAADRPSPPAASNWTCTWRGQRVSCSADAAAIAVYRETQKAYDARLASLSSQHSPPESQTDVHSIAWGFGRPYGGQAGLRGEGRPIAGLAPDCGGVWRVFFRGHSSAVL